LALLLLSVAFGYLQAKENATYQFTQIFEVPADSVMSQGNTGTCWSFSTTSFLESEIYRKTHQWIDLSELYNVRMLYPRKLQQFIYRQGKAQFGEGGLSHDVLIALANYGAVPEAVYSGLVDGSSKLNHQKLAKDLENLADSAVANRNTRMHWKKQADSILNKFMGNPPAEFQWDGKSYTPKTFAATLPISPDDYVEFTSFGFQPYYSKFILNIPDNYNDGAYWNVPLDSITSMINTALSKGFSVALDCDVSEKTFIREPIQMAVFPEDKAADFAHHIVSEKWISAEERDQQFQAYETTDDHLMHIVGLYKDQLGNQYYKVKNSWGTAYAGKGYWMISLAYIRAKAIGIMVNKAAISKTLADKTFSIENVSIH
jgi:bleomycin hydrolase